MGSSWDHNAPAPARGQEDATIPEDFLDRDTYSLLALERLHRARNDGVARGRIAAHRITTLRALGLAAVAADGCAVITRKGMDVYLCWASRPRTAYVNWDDDK